MKILLLVQRADRFSILRKPWAEAITLIAASDMLLRKQDTSGKVTEKIRCNKLAQSPTPAAGADVIVSVPANAAAVVTLCQKPPSCW